MTLDPSNPLPLWAQLRDALCDGIAAGRWPVGTLLPSEERLCDEYGVSRITAARAVNELAQMGLVQRYRATGTVVCAQPPRGAGPAALAFVVRRLDSSWMLDVYAGFEAAAAGAQHFALLASSAGGLELRAEHLERLLTQHARALALSEVLLSDAARGLLPRLAEQGVPLVCVGAYDPRVDCDRVVADNVGAARIAVEHLVALGHRRIAFLGVGEEMMAAKTSLQDRLAGYRRAMRVGSRSVRRAPDRRPEGSLELLDALPTSLGGTAHAARLAAFFARSQATAAVVAHDSLAAMAIHYLRAAGMRVPEDLALVAISDQRIASLVEVPLTSVRIDAAALGAAAARLLLSRLAGDRSPPKHVVQPVHLVVRASCGARTGQHAVEPYGLTHAAQDAATALRAALAD